MDQPHGIRHEITALFAGGAVRRLPLDAAGEAASAIILAVVLHGDGEPPSVIRGFVPVEVPFFERTLFLGHRDFLHVFPDPKLSLSAPSGARYLARSRDKRDGVLIQLLPPLTHTSHHYHAGKKERFINLAGACIIGISGEEHPTDGCDHIVEPGITHYLRTDGDAALNLLMIQGHPAPLADPLTMDDHHYVPFPPPRR
jgi:hypothetical protein